MSPPSLPSPSRSPRTIAVLGIAIVLAGLVLREAWRTATKDRATSPSLDSRFAVFLPFVKDETRVGFVSYADDDEDVMSRRVEFQYALAPIVLVGGADGGRLVAAWADRPERLASLAASLRLRAIATTPDGFALFERASR